ncbi:helix-turn-helix domain-containing protein [Jannaschia formosa]|uniref:helix-turn-helix domain-containing protein n=1 Tax=Jannaschia formosa TaxID=2259592 RepID=UPI000E1C1824|nr:helix-turn-helix domain-containing protein [Jannaschia formosa]TFL16671.1 Cro/Cl family transcriptional regulator [Jannaschia formosa]
MCLRDDPKRIEITEQNLSHLKSGKAHGMPSQPLSFICQACDCRPGTLLEGSKERGV